MPLTPRAPFFAAFALLTLGLCAATADDLTTTNGKKLPGKLVGVDAQGVTFSTGDAQVKLPARDIVTIDLGHKIATPPKDARFHEIELTDGSTLRVAKYALKDKKFETELLAGPSGVPLPTFDLPMTAVFYVMRGADDAKNRDAWKKMLGTRGKRDLYVIREAEALTFVQGTVLGGNAEGNMLSFEKEDGSKAELLQRAATGGLVFHQPPPAQTRQAVCKVLDVFGNSLIAEAVELTESGVTVKTVSGVAVKYASPAALAQLDFARGNMAYLSDLDPQVDSPPVPPDERGLRLNITAPFIRDQGVSGEPLKLGGDVFPKGLVIAPDTTLTYNIGGGDWREFRAVLGLPENSPDANLEAKVTIQADERVLFSETIRRKDKPKGVTLEVKGVKQLKIIVEADLPINGNRVVLGEGRLQK